MKKLKDKIINNKKYILGIITGILISGTTVYAATVISAANVSYSNTSSKLSSTDVQSAIDELYTKANSSKLGKYVSMTPTISSYTTDKTKTGVSSTQTINPKELNLWRIISVNDDGTIDMISEYTSSVAISFYGTTGYKYYVGYLNTLASQYENSTYTKSSRMIGGSDAILTYTLSDNAIKYLTTNQECSTYLNAIYGENYYGGENHTTDFFIDFAYQEDISLVRNSIGTLKAYKLNSTTAVRYYLASRGFYQDIDYGGCMEYNLYPRYIETNGKVEGIDVASSENLYYTYTGVYNSASGNRTVSMYLRPIVTLKSNVTLNGYGTKSSPYTLST